MTSRWIPAAIAACLIVAGGSAEAATQVFSGAGAFAGATTGATAGDFTDVPLTNCSGTACYGGANPLQGFAGLQGVSFSTANFGGSVNVNSAGFYSASDLAVPYLVNSVYTGAGQDIIEITLPGSTTAFGLDFSTLFSSTTATFTLSNGFSTSFENTPGLGETQFLGFVSDTPFDHISFSVPTQQSIVIADFVTARAIPAAPEPATWALMTLGVGLAGLGLRRLRRAGGRALAA